MTLPVGCLVSGENIQQLNETSMSKHFVHELTNFLYVAKETFVLNPLATRSIFEHLNCLLANVKLFQNEPMISSSSFFNCCLMFYYRFHSKRCRGTIANRSVIFYCSFATSYTPQKVFVLTNQLQLAIAPLILQQQPRPAIGNSGAFCPTYSPKAWIYFSLIC